MIWCCSLPQVFLPMDRSDLVLFTATSVFYQWIEVIWCCSLPQVFLPMDGSDLVLFTATSVFYQWIEVIWCCSLPQVFLPMDRSDLVLFTATSVFVIIKIMICTHLITHFTIFTLLHIVSNIYFWDSFTMIY